MSSNQQILKKVRLIDAASSHHNKVLDVHLKDGIIQKIGSGLQSDEAQIVSGENLHLSLGWVDPRANFSDPGNEDREDLDSGAKAAQKGGFTAVALNPQTQPVVDQKAAVEYLKSFSGPVEIIPIGAFTKDLAGAELSELYDMSNSGAKAFSNGYKSIANSALMKLALLYNRELPAPLQVMSYDKAIVAGGQMHEGAKSTWLGLKGIPEMGETLQIARDISIAEYCNSAIHFQGISTEKGLDLIRIAQDKGLAVTADVNVLNLIWTDEALENYDTNLKVYPPLRSESDRKALIEGLNTGLISAIASDHRPRTIEEKRCEFDIALFGAATLEAYFGLLWKHMEAHLGLAKLIEIMTRGARANLNYQSKVKIEEGEVADLTLFDPEVEWQWKDYLPQSKAANYPLANQSLKGKALGTYCKGKWTSL
jgi:dihydroorotase